MKNDQNQHLNELVSSRLLKTAIALKDIKLKDLAQKLKVHPSYISLILKDKKKAPHLRNLILSELNISPEELFSLIFKDCIQPQTKSQECYFEPPYKRENSPEGEGCE